MNTSGYQQTGANRIEEFFDVTSIGNPNKVKALQAVSEFLNTVQ